VRRGISAGYAAAFASRATLESLSLDGHDRFQLPPVVLGCGSIGGIGSAPAFFGQGESEQEAFAIMDAAWTLGIDWFDTADAYGGGRSEAAIGAWIARTQNRPRVTTKTFNPIADGEDHGLSRARVERQIESSLGRLGLDEVDLYLAHEFDPDTPLEEMLASFEELAARGLVGAHGVSNFTAGQLAETLELGRTAVIQNSYSLIDRSDEADVIPLCAERGVAYQAFSPLAGGWLTGKYRRNEPPPPGSRMTMRPEPYLHLDDERVYAGLDALADNAATHGVSTAGLSLAWALSHPHVSSIVVGPRSPAQLAPVAEALALRLSAEKRDELSSLFP
jgi:1-deoxyxylulose-5-phosphate synthase